MNRLTTLKTICINAIFVRYANTHLVFQRQSKTKNLHVTLIKNPADIMFVSQFSLMEISIKLKLGKLPEFMVNVEFITSQLLSDGFEIL